MGTPVVDDQVTAPEHIPSKSELSKTLKEFGRAIRTFSGQFGRPAMVTLCRSLLNGFLPRSRWPAVEKGVYQALQQAFNDTTLVLVEDGDNPAEATHRLPSWASGPPQKDGRHDEL